MVKKLLKSLKTNRGFTLIELLIVVVIIVIVIAVGAVSYTTVARNARNAQRQADLATIAEALEQYFADHGEYPPTNKRFVGMFYTYSSQGDDILGCLLGDPAATYINFTYQNPPQNWPQPPCKEPRIAYIAQGDRNRVPRDPSFAGSDTDETGFWQDGNSTYLYSSNGQSYVLVTWHYEGTAPENNRFTCQKQPYYWNSSGNQGGKDNNQYYLVSPTPPPTSGTC